MGQTHYLNKKWLIWIKIGWLRPDSDETLTDSDETLAQQIKTLIQYDFVAKKNYSEESTLDLEEFDNKGFSG